MKLKETVFAVLSWKVFVLIAAALSTFVLPFDKTFTPQQTEYHFGIPYLLWIWGNFDGIHYLTIAHHGYELLKQPFFPGYPVTISLLTSFFTGHYLVSGLVVSHLAFLASLPILFLLIKKDGYQKNWSTFLLLLLIFPTSYSYGAVYNDSLFFLLASLTLYWGRDKKWLLASVAAALATFTRLNGLVLFFFLSAEWLYGNWVFSLKPPATTFFTKTWTQLSSKTTPQFLQTSSFLLVPAAFFSYLAYIQLTFGNWRLLFSTMEIWGQSSVTFPLIVVARYCKILLLNSMDSLQYWVATVELLFLSWYCILLAYAINKIRFSYWIFFFISILLPWITGTLQGMPRYGLHIYPFFLVTLILYTKLDMKNKITFIFCNLALAFFIITLFTRGYFVT